MRLLLTMRTAGEAGLVSACSAADSSTLCDAAVAVLGAARSAPPVGIRLDVAAAAGSGCGSLDGGGELLKFGPLPPADLLSAGSIVWFEVSWIGKWLGVPGVATTVSDAFRSVAIFFPVCRNFDDAGVFAGVSTRSGSRVVIGVPAEALAITTDTDFSSFGFASGSTGPVSSDGTTASFAETAFALRELTRHASASKGEVFGVASLSALISISRRARDDPFSSMAQPPATAAMSVIAAKRFIVNLLLSASQPRRSSGRNGGLPRLHLPSEPRAPRARNRWT